MGSDVDYTYCSRSQHVRCWREAPQATCMVGVPVKASGRDHATATVATPAATLTQNGSHSRSRECIGRDCSGGTVDGTGTGGFDSQPIRRDSDRGGGRRLAWAAKSWAMGGAAE